MIKAIIFDFDGTLSNRQDNAYYLFKDRLKPYFKDLDEIEYEAVLQDFLTYDCNGTIKVEHRVIPFVDKYKKYLPEDFLEEFKPFYYDYMWKYTVLKEETIGVLEALHGNYKLAVLSNGDSKSQHDKIDACNISKYFDEVLVTGDFGIHKPNKEAFEYVANKLNVKCEECVFVGDVFSSDILGAIKANMHPVWILTDYERATDYKGIIIHNLKELLEVLKNRI